MDKAVLFMNMPETCSDCMFCRELHEGIEACCEIESEPLDESLCRMIDLEIGYCQGRPVWCPLKKIPDVKCDKCFNDFSHGYQCGWNDFRKQILDDETEE